MSWRAKAAQIPLSQAHLAHHRAYRHRYQAADPVIRSAASPVRNIAKKALHPAQCLGALRTLWGAILLTGLARPGQVAPAQNRARPLLKLTHPQLLRLVMRLVKVLARALIARGFAQQSPAAGFVGGSLESARVNEGLGNQDAMAIRPLPIIGEPPQRQLHDFARQIGNVVRLGNKKSAVVDHQRQAPLLLPVRPSNPLLPELELVGPGAPDQQRYPLALILGNVTHLLTHYLRAVQIMAGNNQLIKSLSFLDSNEPDLNTIQ